MKYLSRLVNRKSIQKKIHGKGRFCICTIDLKFRIDPAQTKKLQRTTVHQTIKPFNGHTNKT
jgi:hypothetical protein